MYKTIIIDGIEYNLTPKVLFKKGDFVVIQETTYLISKIEGLNVTLSCNGRECLFDIDVLKNAHLWTIQDAKDGDVLYSHDNNILWIYKNETTYHICLILDYIKYNCISTNCDIVIPIDTYPSTKEQHELLFTKMKEAGYEWDAEHKQLKKIEQNPTELPKGEDYGIDGLYHAINILERTLGKVTGYQSDDGILEHKCAISAVKQLYEQKPAWSKEDEKILQNLINDTEKTLFAIKQERPDIMSGLSEIYIERLRWLKSLKDRI